MKQYQVDLFGQTPLLMHSDNLAFGEKVDHWIKDPANAEMNSGVRGDDRTPAWRWIGYCYHNGEFLGIPSDNLMTMLREGGTKVPAKKGTYKKQTQAGIIIDQTHFILKINNVQVPFNPIKEMTKVLDFHEHIKLAEEFGFELLVKRAKIGRAKHVRVRPMFRNWSIHGSITIIDEEMSGLTENVLNAVLTMGGSLCGLGDWRPSSPSSGTFGRFTHELTKL